MGQIELLAPAGSFEALKSAIAAGANAIYLGGNRFGARAFSANFDNQTIVEAIMYAHIYNVKVYVTLNTIIYDDEMEDVVSYVHFLYHNDVDAVIVQDLGLLSLIRKHFPDLEIHASTQMTIHNLEGARFLEQLGVKRVVLARENSIQEIANINKGINIETEVFVHGALCVSYSGQCLLSALIGGRSGNRGRCAQPCRKKYKLIQNRKIVFEEQYLISPKDLKTIEHINELIEAGITSFKIEGRMKSPEYVSVVVGKYRKAIDQYMKNQKIELSELDHHDLQGVFNRTYTKGFLFGESGNNYVNLENNSYQGIPIGKVIKYQRNKVTIILTDGLSKKDGITFNHVYGMEVSKIMRNHQEIESALKGDQIILDVQRDIPEDVIVYKTSDILLTNRTRMQQEQLNQSIPIFIEGVFKKGLPVQLTALDDLGNRVVSEVECTVETAKKIILDEETILKQISKLKDTPYYIAEANLSIEENIFVPMGILNSLRRILIDNLNSIRSKKHKRPWSENTIKLEVDKKHVKKQLKPEISVFVRTIEQYEVARSKGISTIYLDANLTKTVDMVDSALFNTTDRIQFKQGPNENYPRTLISQIGDLLKLSNNLYHSNVNLNITNSWAIQFLIDQGIDIVTLSYEFNGNKLKNLLFNEKEKLEMIIYGYQEAMVTKHCVFKSNCNFQCNDGPMTLIDTKEEAFPLHMDKKCQMHILNSKIMILKDELSILAREGYSRFRLQFSIENKEETESVIDAYLEYFTNHNESKLNKMLTYHKENKLYTRGFYNKEIV